MRPELIAPTCVCKTKETETYDPRAGGWGMEIPGAQ